LDSGGAHYSQDLSEVDLSDLEDVKVRVNDPAGDVLVHLGSSDYLRRYKIYIAHAQEWRQQFQKLESVDLRYDNQIIVNPDMERAAKQTPLNPSMAKVAAAAGVKPTALLTRVGPNERAVPKPAFELTQDKLDPKAVPSAAKKPAGKPKALTVAAKTPVSTAAEKKPKADAQIQIKTAKFVPAKAKKKPAHAPVLRSAAERRKVPIKKSAVPSKPKAGSGGQKPSPGITKTQSDLEPSD
jgi:cell division protein FtsQ